MFANDAIAATTTPAHGDKKQPELRELTGKIVGSVFYGTMLKAMRDSSLKGKYGHGGRGEEVFGAQLDGLLAERLGQRNNGGVAEALYRHLAPQLERIDAAQAAQKEATDGNQKP